MAMVKNEHVESSEQMSNRADSRGGLNKGYGRAANGAESSDSTFGVIYPIFTPNKKASHTPLRHPLHVHQNKPDEHNISRIRI